MSSFIGHSLAALTIYGATTRPESPPPRRWWWVAWLLVLASAPDFDYLVPALRPTVWLISSDPLGLWLCSVSGVTPTVGLQSIRVTHSILGSLVVPLLTVGMLKLLGSKGHILKLQSTQAVSAGLSHVLLDLLVGVTPTALFWPFSTATIKLPFGILPSAGQLSLLNYYLYQNIFIEIGVLIPICISAYWSRRRFNSTYGQKLLILVLFLISFGFMVWAFHLKR